jgi:hypothetical protein
MRLPQLTFGKVLGGTAVVLVLTTGAAYAHGPVSSADIVNGTIRSIDIGSGQVKSVDILNGTVGSPDVKDESLTANDLAGGSVGTSEIQTDGVAASEVAANSIDSDEIADFTLSNADVNVFYAQVNANGTIASSSGGVSGIHVGAGTYEVDFGRTISSCAYTATQGEAGVGGAGGAIMGVTDRSGNAEAVFVTTRTDANVLADRAFQLVVVC